VKRLNWGPWGSCAVLCVAAALVAGCSDRERIRVSDDTNVQAFGTLQLPLVTPLQSQYRLRDALFDISTRAQVAVATLDSESDPDASSLSLDLQPGSYQINLRDGWRLEQLGDAGAAATSAALLTQNPLAFDVANASVTELVYSFTTNQGLVTFGRGSVSVSVQVTPVEALASCSILDTSSCPSGQTCLLANDGGRTFCAEPGALKVGAPCSSEQCVAGAQCLALDSQQPDDKVCTRFCDPASPRPGCDCRALASPVGVGVCMPRAPGGQFSFSGIANDLPIAALEGWSLCYADTFGDFGSIDTLLSQCNEGQLLLGCRVAGSDTLQLAANAPASDVTFDTGTGNDPHVANGVGWYFSTEWSWGFAPEGAPIERNSCDVVSSPLSGTDLGDGSQRLCFHTGGGALNSGWRCGSNTDLNDSSFERLVFQAP